VSDVVDGENVRVIQRRGRARFLFKPSRAIGIGHDVGGQDFDGDIASESRIVRAVDLAHTSSTDKGGDLVWA
jgi:hypothetical protein